MMIWLLACDLDGNGRPATEAEAEAVTAPVVAIDPASPGSSDDLAALVLVPGEGSAGTTPSHHFRWYRDGEAVPAYDDLAAVPAGETAPGQVWMLEAWSALENESDTAIDQVTIGNGAPEISVTIDPVSPVTSDDLELVVESDDPDGEELTYTVTWYVDGIPADLDDEVLSADETARDEVWSVEVVATDPSGAEASAWDTVTILNSAPELQAVVLSPQPIIGSVDLNCVPVGFTDPDDDEPQYAYQWNISGGGTDCSCHAETPEPVLSNSFYSRGYLVSCEVTPMDDELAGPTVYSAEVEVANEAPDPPTVFIEPENPVAGDELRAIALAQDGDGDLLTVEYLWSVDGADYGSDQVVPGQDVQSGQVWTVEAWASDDELTGASGTASVTVQ